MKRTNGCLGFRIVSLPSLPLPLPKKKWKKLPPRTMDPSISMRICCSTLLLVALCWVGSLCIGTPVDESSTQGTKLLSHNLISAENSGGRQGSTLGMYGRKDRRSRRVAQLQVTCMNDVIDTTSDYRSRTLGCLGYAKLNDTHQYLATKGCTNSTHCAQK